VIALCILERILEGHPGEDPGGGIVQGIASCAASHPEEDLGGAVPEGRA